MSGPPTLPQYMENFPLLHHCLRDEIGQKWHLFLQNSITESKFFASPIEPFGDLTGAPWRLPLASLARTRDIMSGMAPHSAEPITVPTPLEQRLLKGGYSRR
ncbi:hypothetical protein V8C34DRAFT_295447 [Trichoderma compactum]